MNVVQIIGCLAEEPEVHTTANGRKVANFMIEAKRELYNRAGERKEYDEKINVVVWGRYAEAIGERVHKGDLLYVRGRYYMHTRKTFIGAEKTEVEVAANFIALPLIKKGDVIPEAAEGWDDE